MNNLRNPLSAADVRALSKALVLLDRIRDQLISSEVTAKTQVEQHNFSGAVDRVVAADIADLANYRAEKACDARNAVRSLIAACPVRTHISAPQPSTLRAA